MRINRKPSVLFICLSLLLCIQIINPVYAAAEGPAPSSIQETKVHSYPQNTWAWNSVATGPNGDIYLTHKVSSTEIALKKWNGTEWDLLSTVTTSMTGDTSFSDSLDLVVDATGKLHLVFKQEIGSWLDSKRGVKYGVYDGSGWTFSEVEAYSDPLGGKNFYDPSLDVDSQGKAHIAYRYVDSTGNYIRYATNKSGSWQKEDVIVGYNGKDEPKDPDVQVDGNNVIHLSYVKEDNQNIYYGNFYYTKKSLDEAHFPTAEKIVDAVAEEKKYRFSPLTVDEVGNSYVTYNVSNTLGAPVYINSNKSGTWVKETLHTDLSRNTSAVAVYTVGSTTYVLMDSKSYDLSENYYFAMADYGNGWVTGTKTIKPSFLNGATDELTYLVDANRNFMLAFEYGGLREISSLFGSSEDFGLSEMIMGDGNGDGKITPADVQLIYQAIAGKLQLTDLQKDALDMNDDGAVDAKDAILLMKAYLGN